MYISPIGGIDNGADKASYFQMKYFKNNKRVTVDYDPNSPDTFIIEEELFTIRFTNFLIFSGFVLVCCAALFII